LGYGYNVYHKTIDPCSDATLKGLCPMNQGQIPNLQSNAQLPKDTVNQVPSMSFSFQNLACNLETNRKPRCYLLHS
jgi:hypothetical protein